MARITFRRIKGGQVVGFQTVNTLFENDRALDAALEGLSLVQVAQGTELGELSARLDAVEVEASSAASSAAAAQATADAARSAAAAAQASANQARDVADVALGLAQDHVPTLADHEARIFALEQGGGGGGAAATIELPCSASVAIGDCVMIESGVAVRADPLALYSMPAIGVVASKPGLTTAVVQTALHLRGVYSGLTPGRRYFVGFDGRPSDAAPAASTAGVPVAQQVIGFALSDDVLSVWPSPEMFIDQI